MNNEIIDGLVALFPELCLVIGGILILIIGMLAENRVKTSYFAYFAFILIISVIFSISFIDRFTPKYLTYWSGAISFSDISSYLRILLLSVGSICVLMFATINKPKSFLKYEIISIVLFALAGMSLVLISNDLLTMYLAIELSALAIYVCVAMDYRNEISSEAALKYFILGTIASCIYLFGSSLLYVFSGNISFIGIAQYLTDISNNNNGFSTILPGLMVIIILLSSCFKLAAVPFHAWAPDVYQGSHTIITSIIATISKIAGLGIFIKLFYEVFYVMIPQTYQIIIVISALSMIVGSLAAIAQSDIKRLLAYSAINHIGFILLAVVTKELYYSTLSMLNYITIYVMMTLPMFASLLILESQKENISLEDLTGIAKRNPILALSISILMLSMAGIPPFAGFFAKLRILYIAIESGFYYLAILGVIITVISSYYYLRIIKAMYFTNQQTIINAEHIKTSVILRLILGAGALLNTFFAIIYSL